MDAQFQMAMKTLFARMGIELPPERQNEAYAVGVDEQIRMNFFAAPQGYLNVVCDLGKLPEAVDPAVLVNLLKLNCFTPVFPHFHFKVGFNEDKGSVELWLRQKLDGMKNEELAALFDFVVETAGYVKNWIDNPRARQRSAYFTSRLTGNAVQKK